MSITTTSDGTETMSELLFETGAKGVVIEDKIELELFLQEDIDFEYIEGEITYDFDGDARVKGYLPIDIEANVALIEISKKVQHLLDSDLGIDIGPGIVSIKEINEEDWAHSWKEYFKTVKVTDSIVIKPSWENYEPTKDEILIDMDPGMAFGTGTHETTILCLQALEDYVSDKWTILDIGCGTGILGIASVLLGADNAIMVDNDPQAVKIAEENSLKNGTSEKTNIIKGDLLDKIEMQFDLIVANISSNAIEKLIPSLSKVSKPGTHVIFSGILKENTDVIVLLLESNNFTLSEVRSRGDWVAVIGTYV